jgi:hypothetical protein
MEDLTKIPGVLGCAAYSGNSLVADSRHGTLGGKADEIEQFWSAAASVVATNLQMGPARCLVLRSRERQVLLMLQDGQNVLCELEPRVDWRAVAAEIKRRL